ncbi:hypothetical protein BC833DRAFT_568133 [Globomyces pollinis-pini]|nr:hypothetical protein BC833DRAFT_568133 [Globomyces pollinis-pini]
MATVPEQSLDLEWIEVDHSNSILDSVKTPAPTRSPSPLLMDDVNLENTDSTITSPILVHNSSQSDPESDPNWTFQFKQMNSMIEQLQLQTVTYQTRLESLQKSHVDLESNLVKMSNGVDVQIMGFHDKLTEKIENVNNHLTVSNHEHHTQFEQIQTSLGKQSSDILSLRIAQELCYEKLTSDITGAMNAVNTMNDTAAQSGHSELQALQLKLIAASDALVEVTNKLAVKECDIQDLLAEKSLLSSMNESLAAKVKSSEFSLKQTSDELTKVSEQLTMTRLELKDMSMKNAQLMAENDSLVCQLKNDEYDQEMVNNLRFDHEQLGILVQDLMDDKDQLEAELKVVTTERDKLLISEYSLKEELRIAESCLDADSKAVDNETTLLEASCKELLNSQYEHLRIIEELKKYNEELMESTSKLAVEVEMLKESNNDSKTQEQELEQHEDIQKENQEFKEENERLRKQLQEYTEMNEQLLKTQTELNATMELREGMINELLEGHYTQTKSKSFEEFLDYAEDYDRQVLKKHKKHVTKK